MKISAIHSRQILDSRGNPTVETDVTLEGGAMGRAAVPSGASTGEHEAVELRDGNKEDYGGNSVHTAVHNVNTALTEMLSGKEIMSLSELDSAMRELDGTENKGKLGANAILSVSMATARAWAQSEQKPLYEWLTQFQGGAQVYQVSAGQRLLPIPFMNLINGGKHAVDGVDFQEFMIVPHGFDRFSDALRAGATVFHGLKKLLAAEGFVTLVGDEGGYAPAFTQNKDALEMLIKAIENAGYTPGSQISIALDPAVSEIYDDETKTYRLETEDRSLTEAEMIAYWSDLAGQYPIVSLEDGLDENAWSGWAQLTQAIGNRAQIVGDDFLVTNTTRLQRAIDERACSSILVKVNQIGTVTEAMEAINLAMANGMTAMVSHRSGETEDSFIADFVVGLQTGQIKTGSASRSDRMAKYNQLLRIEEELGEKSVYAGSLVNFG